MSLDMSTPIRHFEIEVYHTLHLGPLDVSISNSVIFMWLAVALSIFTLRWSLRSPSLIPRGKQLLAEMFYEFITRQVRQNIHTEADQYLPLMFTLFVFVLSCNLVGLVPGALTPTSQIVVTSTLAIGVFTYAIVLRFERFGLGFFTAFAPPGVPKLLLPLMIPIELISFLARPLTLALRLFANMTAGHMALGVLAVLGLATPWFMQWIPLGFTVIQIALEMIIAFIQAYIFMILSCVYIDDALSDHG